MNCYFVVVLVCLCFYLLLCLLGVVFDISLFGIWLCLDSLKFGGLLFNSAVCLLSLVVCWCLVCLLFGLGLACVIVICVVHYLCFSW